MSLRREMLQVARLSPKLLGDSTGLVRDFLLRQQNPDGGFKDKAGQSDLYYTVFALDGLLALQSPLPVEPVVSYLKPFGHGGELDFVHLCCLARAWAILESHGSAGIRPAGLAEALLERLAKFRAEDGGFSPVTGAESGTVFAAFLALGAYQDLKFELPAPLRLVQSLKFLETPDGAWANDRRVMVGSTNATAAAVTALRNLSVPVNQTVGDWLLARAHPQGGFIAAPGAPLPDLLSTATALHALAGMQVSTDPLKESCLDLVDSLWTNEGGFYGHWGDEHLDCEYTYYGLLALGHLSL